MSYPIDNTTFTLSTTATGVKVDVDIDIALSFEGGPYSQLFLTQILMIVQRSTNNTTFSDIASYNLPNVFSTEHEGSYEHTDTTAVSGTTYYYRIKNDITHTEQQGTPQ